MTVLVFILMSGSKKVDPRNLYLRWKKKTDSISVQPRNKGPKNSNRTTIRCFHKHSFIRNNTDISIQTHQDRHSADDMAMWMMMSI